MTSGPARDCLIQPMKHEVRRQQTLGKVSLAKCSGVPKAQSDVVASIAASYLILVHAELRHNHYTPVTAEWLPCCPVYLPTENLRRPTSDVANTLDTIPSRCKQSQPEDTASELPNSPGAPRNYFCRYVAGGNPNSANNPMAGTGIKVYGH